MLVNRRTEDYSAEGTEDESPAPFGFAQGRLAPGNDTQDMRVPQGRHRAIRIQDKRKCKRGVPDRDSIVFRLATRHFRAGLSFSMPSALLVSGTSSVGLSHLVPSALLYIRMAMEGDTERMTRASRVP